MSDLVKVRLWADSLIRLHLDPTLWSFGFDNAKRRAGLCNFTAHRITVSRYLAARYDDDDVHQILLHEVAHALAGQRAGHGPAWRRVAEDLGYVGSRLHHGETADELAPWVGACPSGHTLYRHRQPRHVTSCGVCSKAFDPRFTITWQHREITPSMRRRAAAATP